MPSDKDPNQIQSGSGTAGRGSITVTSVEGEVGTGQPDVDAQDVESEASIYLAGDNVQDHIDVISSISPPIPNRYGETSQNSSNPSELGLNPNLTEGRYWDSSSSSNVDAQLVNTSTLTVEAVFFPADRGVLVGVVDGNAVAALDLGAVFVEGSPEATSSPSRIHGQNDYTAGSDSRGTVDGITQNIDLVDRVPVSSEYVSVSYDTYEEDFPAHQIATASIDLTYSAGTVGTAEIIHFKSRNDYEEWKRGATYEAYAEEIVNPSLDIFYDDNTSTSVTIDSLSFSVDNPSDPSGSPDRQLSGVTYYDSNDSYTVSWDVSGLFEDSYLVNGVHLRWSSDEVRDAVKYNIENYTSSTDPSNSPTASYPSTSSNFPGSFTKESDPLLWASDPFGRNDTLSASTPTILYSGASSMSFDPNNDSQIEHFEKEDHRYQASTDPSNITSLIPNLSYEFDSTVTLPNDELQIRGVRTAEYGNYDKGGCLVWPSTDYSTGYVPSSGQPDYSALSHASTRSYVRAFDIGDPLRKGHFKVVGEYDTPLKDAFAYDASDTSYDGHPEGAKIEVSTPGSGEEKWVDLMDPDGAFVSIDDSPQKGFIVSYELNQLPTSFSGAYIVAMKITVYNGSPVASSSSFLIRTIEWLQS